jgi:hypothetical protein
MKAFEGNLTAVPGSVYDYERVTGYVDASKITDFAKTFPRLREAGGLYLGSLTTLPEGVSLTAGSALDLRSLTSPPEGVSLTAGGYLYLNSLRSLPEGVSLIAGGHLDLRSLTSLPEGVSLTAGGNLNLRSLTSLPDGVSLTTGGYLYLNSLRSLPEGVSLTAGGNLDLNSLTSLPEGVSLTAGGHLYLPSLRSANKPVGGNTAAPGKAREALDAAFAAVGYSFADGILSRVVSRRGKVSRVVVVGKQEVSYLVTDGDAWSHGRTLKDARDSLLYKIGSRDTTEFKSWKLGKVVSKRDAIRAYRAITGACEEGVRLWMEQRETPERVSVSGILKLTEGAYNAEKFAEFFAVKKEGEK